LDAPDASFYTLVVTVSDGIPVTTATVLITVTSVNEFDPVFTNAPFTGVS